VGIAFILLVLATLPVCIWVLRQRLEQDLHILAWFVVIDREKTILSLTLFFWSGWDVCIADFAYFSVCYARNKGRKKKICIDSELFSI